MNRGSGPSSSASSSPAIHGSSVYKSNNNHVTHPGKLRSNVSARKKLQLQRSSSRDTDSQASSRTTRSRGSGKDQGSAEREDQLYNACLRNDVKEVKSILESAIREEQPLGRAAGCLASIHECSRRGYLEILAMFIKIHCDFELGDRFGMRPLMIAAYSGHLDLVHMLINNGADVTAVNKNQETILHLATKTEQLEVLEFILNHVQLVDVNHGDIDGKTALHVAAITGNPDSVQMLLDFGANPRIRDMVSRTPTHWAAETGHHEVVILLLEAGSTGFEKDADGKYPIHIATSSGHLQVVQSLIDFNSDMATTVDNRQRTALHIACSIKREDIARYLIHNGSVVNAKDERGDRPLHAATIANDSSMVKLLVSEGQAAVNAKNKREETALHIASDLGYAEIIEMLLSFGADLSVREKKGRTALCIAARAGHTAIVDLLIKAERNQSVDCDQGPCDRKYSISSISSQILISTSSLKYDANRGQVDVERAGSVVRGQTRDHNGDFQVIFATRTRSSLSSFKKKGELGKNVSIETTDTQVTNGCESIDNSMSETNYTNCESFSRSMKEILRFLSKHHSSCPEDWKELAYHWKFTPDQVSAIEQQFTGKNSHRDHSYRMLLIWYHCLPSNRHPGQELVEALRAVGKTDVADKVQRKANLMTMSIGSRSSSRFDHSSSNYIPKYIPSAKAFCNYCVIS